jgi:signal peptidase I
MSIEDLSTPIAPVEPGAAVSPAEPVAPLPSAAPVAAWHRFGAELALWLKTVVSAAVYATLIVTFGFQVARVEGRSMEPTLRDHDRLVVAKLPYAFHAPDIGDIVMVRHPNNPDQILVKRVVAGPGDTVEFRNGQLLRNGIPVPEEFIPQDKRSFDNIAPETVARGYYYVLGDHRNNSSDSRLFGAVPRMYILGKIEARWWPLETATVYRP